MNDPDGHGAESCCRTAKLAEAAGVQRGSLYWALSAKDIPTLNTLLALPKSVGMRLSVEPEDKAHA